MTEAIERAGKNTVDRISCIYPEVDVRYCIKNEGTDDEYIYIYHNFAAPCEKFFEDCYNVINEEFCSKGINNFGFSYDYEGLINEESFKVNLLGLAENVYNEPTIEISFPVIKKGVTDKELPEQEWLGLSGCVNTYSESTIEVSPAVVRKETFKDYRQFVKNCFLTLMPYNNQDETAAYETRVPKVTFIS